jgi:hypothetical protein
MPQALLVATRKGLFTYRPDGETLVLEDTAFLGDPVTIALRDPRDGATYAGLNLGHFGCKLHRREPDGTWRELTAPAFPPKPDDAPVVRDPMRGEEVPWKVQQIWALAPDYSQPGGLWCGTIPGGLFHSTDRGETWTLNMPLWMLPERAKWGGGGYDWPGIHSIVTHPAHPERVMVAVSTGGVWRSDDRGQSWRIASQGMRAEYMPPGQEYDPVAQDAHLMVAGATNPDVLWVQHHNGIFRSVDGGAAWTEVTTAKPSAFGFAVAVHPANPDVAWFAPAIKDERRIPVDGKVVVSRTRDGGATFDVLTQGLPDANAYHLIYRHGLVVSDVADSAGTPQLAMGSTTGSLWTSADEGERWTRVSADLPPIYALHWVG